MKAENLEKLSKEGFNVPRFIVIESEKDIDLSFSNAELFAVRSSYCMEDSKNKSYAGQFETFLNVSRENIFDAVHKVRESYKINNSECGNKDSKIIIQEMIQSELSGILFTANPIGVMNEFVIVVGKGLGNHVVENKINTTTYHYNVDDRLYCYIRDEDSPLLKDEILKELIEKGKLIESIFADKMDIEFGIVGDTIYMLQARPITTISKNKLIILDNSNIVESYPGVSLPLTQSFVKEIYYSIFKSCVARICGNDKIREDLDGILKDMVEVVNGRIYYRINNWYSLLKLLPFNRKLIKVWRQMLGVQSSFIVYDKVEMGLTDKVNIYHSFLKSLWFSQKDMKILNEFFNTEMITAEFNLQSSNTIPELLGVYQKEIDRFISKWDITLINDLYTFIFTALSGKNNKKTLAEIKNLESLRPVKWINKLVDDFYTYGEDSEKFNTNLNNFILLYGDRCLGELKLETKTYQTNPELLLSYIKKQKIEENKEFSEEENKKQGFFAEKAKQGIYNREISRMNRSRLFGFARKLFLKTGSILYAQGHIDHPRDVFYLYNDEIGDESVDKRKRIKERKKEYERYEQMPGFHRLVFHEKVVTKLDYLGVVHSVISENQLQGEGISDGIIEGEILVINSPGVEIDTTDKIIVTRATDPGWVYLIRNCKGIIAEQGSLLSHTAIISRELKKPAVVGVKNATALLKNGEKVRINGLDGTIDLLGD